MSHDYPRLRAVWMPETLFTSLFSEVRSQLSEQLKVLDAQLEQKTQQLQDLSDYLRRRGEIEAEYARSLEKLSERFTLKTKKYIILTIYMKIIITAQYQQLAYEPLMISFSLFLKEGAHGPVCVTVLVNAANTDQAGEPGPQLTQ